MSKRWQLIGLVLALMSMLLAGCGVAQEQYDSVVAEKNSAQTELTTVKGQLQSTQSELDKAKAELQSVSTELDKAKAELRSVSDERDTLKGKLATAQSSLQAREQTMAQAKLLAEIVSMVFIPAITKQKVNEVELLFQWRDKVKGAGDAELQKQFDAVMALAAARAQQQLIEQKIADLFVYILEKLPKMLGQTGI